MRYSYTLVFGFIITTFILLAHCTSEQPAVNDDNEQATLQRTNTNTISIAITFDKFPEDISWKIKNKNTGKVMASRSTGTYGGAESGRTIKEKIQLPTRRQYRFIINDTMGDGLNCPASKKGKVIIKLSNGDELCTIDGDFGDQAGCNFAVIDSDDDEDRDICRVVIKFDSFPKDIGWKIKSKDGTKVFASRDVGTYEDVGSGSTVRENVILLRGEDYKFIIEDAMGDGLNYPASKKGKVQIQLADGSVLCTIDGDFKDQATCDFYFPGSDDDGDRDICRVVIKFDRFPEDIGWKIKAKNGTKIFASRDVGTYEDVESESTITEEVLLLSGKDYEFIIEDAMGDGLNYPASKKGKVQIQLADGSVLCTIDGDFKDQATCDFYFLGSGDEPEGEVCKIQIKFDRYPEDIGWKIKAKYGTKIFASKDASTYEDVESGSTVTEDVILPVGEDYEFIIEDAMGDGLNYPASMKGWVKIKRDNGNVLCAIDGDFKDQATCDFYF